MDAKVEEPLEGLPGPPKYPKYGLKPIVFGTWRCKLEPWSKLEPDQFGRW